MLNVYGWERSQRVEPIAPGLSPNQTLQTTDPARTHLLHAKYIPHGDLGVPHHRIGRRVDPAFRAPLTLGF